MINDSPLGWMGTFKIRIKNTLTGEITDEIVKNRITNTALNAMINTLDDIEPQLNIKYLAIGTGSTAIDDADTQLDTEIARVQFTSSNLTAIGEFTTEFVVLDSEAVATWAEIGIFCGDTATSSANTGIMLTRILYDRVKTSLEEIQFIRIDKIERA